MAASAPRSSGRRVRKERWHERSLRCSQGDGHGRRIVATPLVIANVSRRKFLQGATALGGLVLAVGYADVRARRRPAEVRRRWHAARLGRQPAGIRRHRRGRHRQHRLRSLRDGPGHTHRHADHRCRRARSRLGARAGRAGDGRRRALRQPGHRRLAQHAPFLHADAPLRRGGAPDAGSRGRRALEGAGQRSSGEERRGRAHADRPASRLRRAREGGGEHAASRSGCDQAQGPVAVSLHRHRQAEAPRRPGHRHRQGAVRDGHAPARHALRGRGATAGVRRQGRERRRRRGAQGSRRGPRRANRSPRRERRSSIRSAALP